MKQIKAPAVKPKLPARKPKKPEPTVFVLREKFLRPLKSEAIVKETSRGDWKISYTIGKTNIKVNHTFPRLEDCITFLNANGSFKIFNKKGVESSIK